MSSCNICKRGTLLSEQTGRSIEIRCSSCGRGWHIPLTPPHPSPCNDPYFKPPIPRQITRDRDYVHEDRDFPEPEGDNETEE